MTPSKALLICTKALHVISLALWQTSVVEREAPSCCLLYDDSVTTDLFLIKPWPDWQLLCLLVASEIGF